MTTPFLHQLLQNNLTCAPEYCAGLSNHRSMALHALHALGASDARMRAFYDSYDRHFSTEPAAPESVSVEEELWAAQLGNIAAFASLEAQFAAMLARDGVHNTLATVLPVLWPGMAGVAFHGLIRTAHALESEYAFELSTALAYWAARWQATPVPPPKVILPFAQWAAQLKAAAADTRSSAPTISRRMAEAIKTEHYAKLAGSLKIEVDTVTALSHWIAQRYSETGNFTVLHMLTGLRAVLVLMPIMPKIQAEDALKQAISSLVAAYFAANIDESRPTISVTFADDDWHSFIAKAIASNDEHDIKLMHTLDWLWHRDPAAVYVAAATRLCACLG